MSNEFVIIISWDLLFGWKIKTKWGPRPSEVKDHEKWGSQIYCLFLTCGESGGVAWPCFFLSPFFPASLVLLSPCLFFSCFINLFPSTVFSPFEPTCNSYFSVLNFLYIFHISPNQYSRMCYGFQVILYVLTNYTNLFI